VRLQFEIGSAEGVTLAGSEIGERHLVSAADFRIQMMNLAGESVRWKPLCHCVRVQERPINFLRRGPEHPVETDRVCGVCCHNRLSFQLFSVRCFRGHKSESRSSECQSTAVFLTPTNRAGNSGHSSKVLLRSNTLTDSGSSDRRRRETANSRASPTTPRLCRGRT
jgi:hypothetical protein